MNLIVEHWSAFLDGKNKVCHIHLSLKYGCVWYREKGVTQYWNFVMSLKGDVLECGYLLFVLFSKLMCSYWFLSLWSLLICFYYEKKIWLWFFYFFYSLIVMYVYICGRKNRPVINLLWFFYLYLYVYTCGCFWQRYSL